MKFEDLDFAGNLSEVREIGLFEDKGRDYEVLDGDVITFKFNGAAK